MDKCSKIKINRVKHHLLHDQYGEEEIKLRVAGDAKEPLCQFLEKQVNQQIDNLLNDLPRKKTGELKRVTIQEEDMDKYYEKLRVRPDPNYSKLEYIWRDQVNSRLKVGEQKIRVSGYGHTRTNFYQLMDEIVKKSVKDVINVLPRKKKGERKGQIMRMTIQKEDFE